MTDTITGPRLQIEGFRKDLLYLARRYLADLPKLQNDASDAVQQTMLKAHENLDRFRGHTDGELFAWMRRILENLLVDWLRKAKHDPARLSALIRNLDHSSARIDDLLVADHTPPPEAVEKRERLLLLFRVLQQLPAKQRRVMELRYLHDPPRSLEAIAVELGKTEKAVAGLLCRGMATMRKLMLTAETVTGP